MLRRPIFRGLRPRHVFVTHNGDWPHMRANPGRDSLNIVSLIAMA